MADPFQNLQTVFPGHLDVEESECGKGKVLTICEWPLTLQIINCLLAIPHYHNRVVNARTKQSPFNEQSIVHIILGQKNYEILVHCGCWYSPYESCHGKQ